ncbi:MAG: alpha/beta fold hydrolase [Actinomycetota bacterium]|nr:alpha/beta fold hydrolase [Actinomycetota bacterium]
MGEALELTAGHPLETPLYPIGRRSTMVVDPARAGRLLGVEIWYPAAVEGAPLTSYELMPGATFRSAGAQHDVPARPGKYPLILFSHGRTGMRFAYAMICEALAARGSIVVSADHPGDALFDWLLGTHTDDRTNEVNRVADAHLVLDTFLQGRAEVPIDVANAIDHEQVVLAGHSYGAYTAFATAAGSRGVAAHPKVQAIIGLQPYTSTMSDSLLARIDVPTLLVVSGADTSAPPEANADRPWALLAGRPVWRLDIEGAAHQASSDVPLYAELVHRIAGVPQIARDYLESSASGTAIVGDRSWRQVMQVHVEVMWAFLQVVLRLEPEEGVATAERLDDQPGLVLRRR